VTSLADDITVKNPLHCIILKYFYNKQNPGHIKRRSLVVE